MTDDVDTARALIDAARKQVIDARRRIEREVSKHGTVSAAAWASLRAADLTMAAAEAAHLRVILEQPTPRPEPAKGLRLVLTAHKAD